jgi:hypothetical protein
MHGAYTIDLAAASQRRRFWNAIRGERWVFQLRFTSGIAHVGAPCRAAVGILALTVSPR